MVMYTEPQKKRYLHITYYCVYVSIAPIRGWNHRSISSLFLFVCLFVCLLLFCLCFLLLLLFVVVFFRFFGGGFFLGGVLFCFFPIFNRGWRMFPHSLHKYIYNPRHHLGRGSGT